MDGHNHLDRQVRPRGECPGCDTIWDRQTARLTTAASAVAVIRQLERMADKPKSKPSGFCLHTKVLPTPENIHTCGLPTGHPAAHWCPLCDQDWSG